MVVGVALRLFCATRSLDTLLTQFLPDDAFYYFRIARNSIQGFGSTFDGINFTNGYHPLWMTILLPIFSWFSEGGVHDVAPVTAALIVGVLLDIGTVIILYRLVTRITKSAWIQAFVAAIWLFNPFILFEIINGLETSLSLFLISAFILCVVIISERTNHALPAARWYIIASVVGGFMMLARLDNVFYFAAFLGWIVVRSYDKEKGIRKSLSSLRIYKKLAACIVIAGVVVSPWFIWNYQQSGMLFTSASVTSTVVNHGLIEQDHGPSFTQKIKAVVYSTDLQLRNVLKQTGAPEFFLIFLGFALAFFSLTYRETLWLRIYRIDSWPVIAFLFLGWIVNFIANASIRWAARSWYFVAFEIFLVLFIAFILENAKNIIPYRKVCACIVIAIVAYSFVVGWSKDLRDRNSAQREMYAMSQWMNDSIPVIQAKTGQKTVIGVFNAGIQGYFSKHTVINLDGLVNNKASQAMLSKNLWAYIKGAGVSHIADYPLYMTYRYKSFLGVDDPLSLLEPIHTIAFGAHSRSADGITLYRVK